MKDKTLEDKAINFKGKKYVEVKDRINYLSENCERYSIDSEYTYYPDRKMWVVKSTLTIDENIYVGLAQEIESDNYKEVNFKSALENCQTSAVGRACAMAGIGVIDSVASLNDITRANVFDLNESKTVEVNKPLGNDRFTCRCGKEMVYKKIQATGKEVYECPVRRDNWKDKDIQANHDIHWINN